MLEYYWSQVDIHNFSMNLNEWTLDHVEHSKLLEMLPHYLLPDNPMPISAQRPKFRLNCIIYEETFY